MLEQVKQDHLTMTEYVFRNFNCQKIEYIDVEKNKNNTNISPRLKLQN